MSKRIVIIGLLMFVLTAANAQKRLNYIETDKKSYQLFTEKKWDELIQFSTEARKQGIDFFYLQVRTGIALYNQEKYRKASSFFLKAWENDKSFEWLQEYVYYSLIYSGRGIEASSNSLYYSRALKKKIGFINHGITRLAYEGGYSTNAFYGDLSTRSFAEELNIGSDYGEGYFLKDYSFHAIDLSHRVTQNLSINHNFTFINLNRQAFVDWGEQSNYPIKINQYQYFINPVWLIGNKINVSTSLNLIFGKYDIYAGTLNNNLEAYFYLAQQSYFDFAFSNAIWANVGNFAPGIEINAGKISGSLFTQLSTWFTVYPFSNTKLYLTPRIYFNSNESFSAFNFMAIGISGGAQLGPIHLYAQYVEGDLKNFIESNGYVVYNFPGKLNRKISGSIFFPIGKKYHFVIRYINQSTTENYQVYTDGINTNTVEFNNFNHTITGGISWNI